MKYKIPKTYMGDNIGYYTKIKEHTGGAYFSYATMPSMQVFEYTANVTPEGTYVPLSSTNASSVGTVWSKENTHSFGGVYDGRVAIFNENAKGIHVEVFNTKTGLREQLLTPNANPVTAYEKLPWEALSYNDNRASLSWQHSLEGGDMIPFKDHVVLKVLTNSSFKRYYNPVVINYATPNKLNVIVPNFPSYNTEDSEEKSTWSYYGSTESLHVYAKRYMNRDKRRSIDTCINIITTVDNEGKVVSSFIVNMKMSGLEIKKMDKSGLNGYYNYKGETTIWLENKLNCVIAIAGAKDKSGNDIQIVKRFDLDGKLIWESANKVDGYNLSYEIILGNKLRMDAGDGMDNILDLNTGALIIKKKKYKDATERICDELGKSDAAKLQKFMAAHKDHKKILECFRLNEKEYIIAFYCSQATIKLYRFGSGT